MEAAYVRRRDDEIEFDGVLELGEGCLVDVELKREGERVEVFRPGYVERCDCCF